MENITKTLPKKQKQHSMYYATVVGRSRNTFNFVRIIPF